MRTHVRIDCPPLPRCAATPIRSHAVQSRHCALTPRRVPAHRYRSACTLPLAVAPIPAHTSQPGHTRAPTGGCLRLRATWGRCCRSESSLPEAAGRATTPRPWPGARGLLRRQGRGSGPMDRLGLGAGGERRRGFRGARCGRCSTACIPRDAADPPAAGRARRLGFDLTFSAPKSVSILYGVGATGRLTAVRDAHDARRQRRARLPRAPRLPDATRQGRHGERRGRRVPRRSVPAPHIARRRPAAAHPRRRRQRRRAAPTAAGARWTRGACTATPRPPATSTRRRCARELSERLGVDWTPVAKGAAEISGVPRAADPSLLPAARRDHPAARAPRPAVAGGGASRDARHPPAQGVRRPGRPAARRLASPRAGARLRPRETSTRCSTARERFDRAEPRLRAVGGRARRRARRHARGEHVRPPGRCPGLGRRRTATARPSADIEALADAWLQRTTWSSWLASTAGSRSRCSRPAELLEIEQDLLAVAERRQRTDVARGHRATAVDAAVAGRPSIAAEQIDLVDRLVTSGDGIQVVRSAAGTGKTFALDAAREAWEPVGGPRRRLRAVGARGDGAARPAQDPVDDDRPPQARHRPRLRAGARQRAHRRRSRHGRHTRPRTGSPQHAEAVGAKLVLVGDDRQLPEIDAGGAFRALADQLGALELREVRRQRRALGPRRAPGAARRRRQRVGRRLPRPRATHRRAKRRCRPVKRSSTAGGGTAPDAPDRRGVMVALRRRDVADLNERARERMRAAGELEPRRDRAPAPRRSRPATTS